jgi:hypothetical protein
VDRAGDLGNGGGFTEFAMSADFSERVE